MILDATTDALEIVLDKVVTTELNFVTYYTDYTSTTITPTASYGVTNSTSSVNLVPSPLASHQHQLKYCAINNIGSQDVGTKIRFNNNGSYRNLSYVFLRASESIQYTEENGWRVYDVNGSEKASGYCDIPGSINMPEWFGAAGVATTQALTNGTAFCTYLGKADRPYSSVKLQYRVTTGLGATVSWAEAAIYKGNPTLSSGSIMTRLGYTNTSGVWNGTGVKTTTIPMTGSVAIGDNLWAVFSNSTTGTVTSFRAGLADTGSAGFLQTSASCQPSTSTNTTITGTVDANTPMLWITWQGVYQGT